MLSVCKGFALLIAQDEEIECELAMDNEQFESYDGKLEKSYDAPSYEVVCDIFCGLVRKSVIKSNFKSSLSTSGIKSSLKANEAMLYPLDKQILSYPKPVLVLPLNEIVTVTFSRVGSSTKTFEVKFSMDSGIQHSFSSIPREEFSTLESYCLEKRLNVENEMEADTRMVDDISDESEDDGERKFDFSVRGPDHEDEGSSVDEDFVVAKKDVASDVSSEASSVVSDEDVGGGNNISDEEDIASQNDEEEVVEKGILLANS